VTGSMKSAFGTPTSCYIDGRDEGISDYFETWKGFESRPEVFDILDGDSSIRAEELDSLKGGDI
jgi:hypothetical protein